MIRISITQMHLSRSLWAIKRSRNGRKKKGFQRVKSSHLSAHCPDCILSISCYCLTVSLKSGRTCAESVSPGKLQLWRKYGIWNTSVDFRETLRLDATSDSLGVQRTTMFTRSYCHFDALWSVYAGNNLEFSIFLNTQLAAQLIIHTKCSITNVVCFFLISASSLQSVVVTNVLYSLFQLISICRTHN